MIENARCILLGMSAIPIEHLILKDSCFKITNSVEGGSIIRIHWIEWSIMYKFSTLGTKVTCHDVWSFLALKVTFVIWISYLFSYGISGVFSSHTLFKCPICECWFSAFFVNIMTAAPPKAGYGIFCTINELIYGIIVNYQNSRISSNYFKLNFLL